MTEYDNNLRGVLFKNDRKEKASHPDYKGSCEVDGVEFWISAWIKEGQRGKFMSLSFTEKEEQQEPRREPPKTNSEPARPRSKPRQADYDDDIPF